jgi:hypothetical protein
MRPYFTSRSEWPSAASAGERGYVREATGYLVRGGLLGMLTLAGPLGAVDPYWRSLPVLALSAVCLGAGAGLGALLFRREWRAAARAYGLPEALDTAPRPHAPQ